MSWLRASLARCGVNTLRALLLCTFLLGITASAQPPPDEPAADAAEAPAWNFDDEEEEPDPCVNPERWRVDIAAQQQTIIEVKNFNNRAVVDSQLNCYIQQADARGIGFTRNSTLNSGAVAL